MIVERVEKSLRQMSADHPMLARVLSRARPYVGRIIRRFKRVPQNYRDVVSDYGTYVFIQTETHRSHEIENPRWEAGQQRCLDRLLATVPRDARILDIASGDGVGLRHFRALNFADVTGVELSKEKAVLARESGYPVVEADMHDLSVFPDASFDVVYSSHTLEHAYEPRRVVDELRRVLRPGGELYVVLPYPDPPHSGNEDVHGGKFEIGTHLDDGGRSVQKFFQDRSFRVKKVEFDSYREPEIWLQLAAL